MMKLISNYSSLSMIADIIGMISLLLTTVCMTTTLAQYTTIDSPASPGDVNKTSLTIMGLFPMEGYTWPAGNIHMLRDLCLLYKY